MAESPLESLLNKVRQRVAETRTRLSEFFKTFDQHNSKKITFDRAIRALDLMNLRLTAAEKAILQKYYCNSIGLFQYDAFCEDIDEVFTVPRLERSPDKIPTSPLKKTRTFGSDLTRSEQFDLDELLSACRHWVKTQGILVKDFFRDNDGRNSGFVTAPQFQRGIMKCFKALTEADVALLVKAYGNGLDVNYRQFHVDVSEAEGSAGGSGAGASSTLRSAGAASLGLTTTLRASGPPPAPADVMTRIIRKAAEDRIRVREFFLDFDHFRFGVVTNAQFKRVLAMSKLEEVAHISAMEMEELCDRFASTARGPNMVDYDRFCQAIEEAFTRNGLETNPKATVHSPSRAIAKAPRREAPPRFDDSALGRGLSSIARLVKQRGLELIPTLKDFDRTHEEHVTVPQFRRALTVLKAMPATEEEFEAIARHFAGKPPKHHMVDYRTFVQAVDPKVQLHTYTLPATKPMFRKVTDPAALMERIKRQVLRDRIRLAEFFRDFDPLSKGSITRAQLESGLSQAGIPLAHGEAEALAQLYPYTKAFDAAGAALMDWRAFTNEVEELFTLQGLERRPDADVVAGTTVARISSDAIDGATRRAQLSSTLTGGGSSASPLALAVKGRKTDRLTPAQAKQLEEVLYAIQERRDAGRIEMAAAFGDFDRHKRGFITAAQFQRTLTRLGLGEFLPHTELLVKAFSTGAADRSDINYKWFLEGVEDPLLVIANLPDEGIPPPLAGTKVFTQTFSAADSLNGSDTAVLVREKEIANAEDVVQRLREKAKAEGLKLKPFFEDYDKLRHGIVPPSKLRTAFAAAKVPLTAAELTALEEKYRSNKDPAMVSWIDLSLAIDGGDEMLEKDPKRTLQRVQFGQKTIALDTSGALQDPLAQQEVQGLLNDVSRAVKRRGVDLKEFFLDFDPLRTGMVPKSRFKSVLGSLVGLLPGPLQQLSEYFGDSQHQDKVRYTAFIARVQPEPGASL